LAEDSLGYCQGPGLLQNCWL